MQERQLVAGEWIGERDASGALRSPSASWALGTGDTCRTLGSGGTGTALGACRASRSGRPLGTVAASSSGRAWVALGAEQRGQLTPEQGHQGRSAIPCSCHSAAGQQVTEAPGEQQQLLLSARAGTVWQPR